MENNCVLIIAIANKGYSETVMNSARATGAAGGTILSGRGTISKTAQKFFGITIQEEKEIVLILVKKELRPAVMSAISESVGMSSPGQGVVFSLPVEETLGINFTPFDDK